MGRIRSSPLTPFLQFIQKQKQKTHTRENTFKRLCCAHFQLVFSSQYGQRNESIYRLWFQPNHRAFGCVKSLQHPLFVEPMRLRLYAVIFSNFSPFVFFLLVVDDIRILLFCLWLFSEYIISLLLASVRTIQQGTQADIIIFGCLDVVCFNVVCCNWDRLYCSTKFDHRASRHRCAASLHLVHTNW